MYVGLSASVNVIMWVINVQGKNNQISQKQVTMSKYVHPNDKYEYLFQATMFNSTSHHPSVHK